jgi:hypothetical protein
MTTVRSIQQCTVLFSTLGYETWPTSSNQLEEHSLPHLHRTLRSGQRRSQVTGGRGEGKQDSIETGYALIGSTIFFFLNAFMLQFATPHAREKSQISKKKVFGNPMLSPLDIALHSTFSLYLPPRCKTKLKSSKRRSQLIVIIGLVILRTTRSTSSSVELGGDGVCDVGQLLLLLFEVFSGGGGGVLFEPVGSFLDSFEDLFRIISMYSIQFRITERELTVSLSSSSILPPRPSSSLTWFFRLKA